MGKVYFLSRPLDRKVGVAAVGLPIAAENRRGETQTNPARIARRVAQSKECSVATRLIKGKKKEEACVAKSVGMVGGKEARQLQSRASLLELRLVATGRCGERGTGGGAWTRW